MLNSSVLMMNIPTLFLLIFFLSFSFYLHGQDKYPEVNLSNEHLEVRIYPPDINSGFYRAARFDWSGVIGSLQYKGHQYFDHWLEQHDPLNFESCTGPVEGFAPIGYEEAQSGENFLIIGVGMLQKPNEENYHFATPYKIVNHGKWKTKSKKDRITSTQKLSAENGFSYEYSKTVRLIDNKAKIVLQHEFKNTGDQTIETTVYNHNFFVIDQEPTGPNIVTKFPYPIQAEGRGFGDLIKAEESSLTFTRKLERGENVYTAGIEGFRSIADDYQFSIENRKTGAGVKITADRPLLKLAYWACHSTACPEPFLEIKVAPGETYTWTIEYDFYEF